MTFSPPTAFRAAWVFPVGGPPLRNGIVEVDAAGRIVAVRSGRDHDAIDLGDVALVPALVNAHAHLEFSDLAAPIGPVDPFPVWVKNVVAHRRGRTEPVEAIVRRGLDQTLRTGTALVGEIATSDVSYAPSFGELGLVLFRELIGPLPDPWPGLLAGAEQHLKAAGASSSAIPGLSPHAPYTVPQELFDRAVDLAARYSAPVAVHLAETASERELLANGAGELVEMMRSLDLWRPELHPLGRRPLDWIERLRRVPRGLVVHGNFLDDDELDLLAASPNLSLVYCPRTHAYFDHPPHPFRRLLGRGGRVVLGTDGRSSNPDLDLWRDAAFVRRRHSDLSSDTILELATRCGAEALGLGDRHGILAPGRLANFLAVAIREPDGGRPPDLFASSHSLLRVFRGGTEIDCHDGGPLCHD